ncbi:histidine triad nucleotide-binding protein [Neofamilia massiliensis]|uniref:histidine triad nucleotide-binding protein n=1 Tax=Neofamilia massiliensis TaxID=1673724 RepID=UPI0006BB6485|nr:histidine triad nucleotide-binding protein [Neofamilia massiliensis]
MTDCIFCKIIGGEIPSKKVYEDEFVYAFNDLEPQAPVHVLVIPKKHISNVDEIVEEDKELIGHIYLSISKIAKDLGLEKGYRVVVNNKEHGGQSVSHLHFHLLGGRQMTWPAG